MNQRIGKKFGLSRGSIRACGLFILMVHVCSCASAQGFVRDQWPFHKERVESGSPEDDPSRGSAGQSLRDGIVNGSFEESQDNFVADGWRTSLFPRIEDRFPAFDGEQFVRISSRHFFSQRLRADLPAWQSVSFAMMGRSQMGQETGRVRAGLGHSMTITREAPFPVDEWAPFYAAYSRRANLDRTEIVVDLLGRSTVDWVDIDDVFVVFEEPAFGDFEGSPSGESERLDWLLNGDANFTGSLTALEGEGALRLGPGGEATQLVAHTPHVVKYFVAGRSTGVFRLKETRIDTTGSNTSVTSATITPRLDGRFLLDLPKDDNANIARLHLSNDGSTDVIVDEVTRGWTSLWPKRIIVAENSPSGSTRLSAAWQGALATAEVNILDGSDEIVYTINDFEQDEGTVYTTFHGADLQEGDYTVEFRLTASNGLVYRKQESLRIDRPSSIPERLADIEFNQFMRQAWLWFGGTSTYRDFRDADEFLPHLQAAKSDGFNQIWVVIDEPQYPGFKEAAAEVGLPYVISFAPPRPSVGHLTYDPTWFLDALEPLEFFLDSDLFAGIYIDDEPNVGGEGEVARALNEARLMELDGRWPPAYSFQNPNRSIDTANFPIVSTFNYPVRREVNSLEETFRDFVEGAEADIGVARGFDRPFWQGTQGYGSYIVDPVMSRENASAQLGMALASGADGIFVFLYSSLGPFMGLRGHDLQETMRLRAYQDFNSRIDDLWEQIGSLPKERSIPEQENVFSRSVFDDNDRTWLFLVNYEEPSTVDVVVTTTGTTTLVDVESQVASEPGTSHQFVLAPGEWRVLRTSDPVGVESTIGDILSDDLKLLDIPIVTTFTQPDGQAIRSVAIDPSGQFIAGAGDPDFLFYDNEGNLLFQNYQEMRPGYVNFTSETTVFSGSESYSSANYRLDGDEVIREEGFVRTTGGAFDLAKIDDKRYWATSSFRGVSILEDTNNGLQIIANTPSELFDFYSLHGPYEDGSVLAVEHVKGVYRMTFEGETITKEKLTEDGNYLWGDESPSGRISIGRGDRGISILDVDPTDGSFTETRIDNGELTHAEWTAWIGDDLLAVSDTAQSVRFYRVPESGGWEYEGEWRPLGRREGIRCIDATPSGKIVVVPFERDVIVGDASGLLNIGNSWQLY